MNCNFDTVVKFMIEYDVQVPIPFLFGIIILMSGIIIFLYYTKDSYSSFIKSASFCLLMGYAIVIISATILFRSPKPEMTYYICPFWTYGVLYNRMLAENILNIFMFIPIGFFTGVGLGVKKTITILCIGFMLSVAIEVIQLVTRRGICNIDDVIHNTIGCIIGYGLFRLFYMMKPWLQCKLKTT